jgi:hypothetical protein
MTQEKIETATTILGSFGLSIGAKIGIETALPMEHELLTTGIHLVGTIIGGVSIWLITDWIKRKRAKK